jgi:hypothetical protein
VHIPQEWVMLLQCGSRYPCDVHSIERGANVTMTWVIEGWDDGGVVFSMLRKVETRCSRQSGWLPFMFLSRRADNQDLVWPDTGMTVSVRNSKPSRRFARQHTTLKARQYDTKAGYIHPNASDCILLTALSGRVCYHHR